MYYSYPRWQEKWQLKQIQVKGRAISKSFQIACMVYHLDLKNRWSSENQTGFVKILDRFHRKSTKPIQNLIFEIWEKKIKNQPILLKTERFFSLSNGFLFLFWIFQQLIFVSVFPSANFLFSSCRHFAQQTKLSLLCFINRTIFHKIKRFLKKLNDFYTFCTSINFIGQNTSIF
jgi:hypothetical protein